MAVNKYTKNIGSGIAQPLNVTELTTGEVTFCASYHEADKAIGVSIGRTACWAGKLRHKGLLDKANEHQPKWAQEKGFTIELLPRSESGERSDRKRKEIEMKIAKGKEPSSEGWLTRNESLLMDAYVCNTDNCTDFEQSTMLTITCTVGDTQYISRPFVGARFLRRFSAFSMHTLKLYHNTVISLKDHKKMMHAEMAILGVPRSKWDKLPHNQKEAVLTALNACLEQMIAQCCLFPVDVYLDFGYTGSNDYYFPVTKKVYRDPGNWIVWEKGCSPYIQANGKISAYPINSGRKKKEQAQG